MSDTRRGLIVTPEEERPMSETRREVVVTDIRMPFWSMVIFMVKFSVASIPAVIVLAILYLVGVSIGGLVAGIMGWL